MTQSRSWLMQVKRNTRYAQDVRYLMTHQTNKKKKKDKRRKKKKEKEKRKKKKRERGREREREKEREKSVLATACIIEAVLRKCYHCLQSTCEHSVKIQSLLVIQLGEPQHKPLGIT